MSSYYREQGFSSRKRFLRRLRYIWALLLLSLIVVGGFFAYDAINQNKQSNIPSAESKAETSFIDANIQLVTNSYYQFQSPKAWKAIANESRSNHFLYRQYNGPLLEQELVIDINQETEVPLTQVQITRVLPVNVSASGKLTPDGSVSPHCEEVIKPKKSGYALSTTFKNVNFDCNPSTSNYFVVVGLVGGSDSMMLPRPNGSKARYNITYKNLTAQPSIGDLDNIIETFETR
jgi:hypothetical protein